MDTVRGLFDVNDEQKRALLQELHVLHLGNPPRIEDLLISARIHCLSKIELYFLQSPAQLRQPLNLRNEAAAVSLLLVHFQSSSGDPALAATLSEYSSTLWPELASGDVGLTSSSNGSGAGGSGQPEQQQAAAAAPPQQGKPLPAGSPASDFEAWAREQGVAAAISLASFGSLRGCAASRDVAPGEPLLSLPADVLIYEDSVRSTDLGRMLHAIPGLAIDNLLVLFTMIDRHDEDSKWYRYWRSLPYKFYTGISFPQPLVDSLAGTAAHLELTRAQQHLWQQYADTRPLFDMLLAAYPQLLNPEWFDYESYLWAAELWYSYAFKVEFPSDKSNEAAPNAAAEATPAAAKTGGPRSSPRGKGVKLKGRGGKAMRSGSAAGGHAACATSASGGDCSSGSSSSSSKPVMVPFACHINHSPWPHCVRYGRLNPETLTLDYPAFRPCQAGQQVFISYGPVPNLKLLCYYGFVVPDNPHDLVPLQLEPPDGPHKQRQMAAMEALELGLEHSLQDGPLSKQLLACLRLLVATAAELQLMRKHQADPLAGAIAPENEDQALRTLEAALLDLLVPLECMARQPDHTLPAEGLYSEEVVEKGTSMEQQEELAAGGSGGRVQVGPVTAQVEDGVERLRLQSDAEAKCGSLQHAAAPAEPPAAGQQQEGCGTAAEQQQQPDQCNENGFDADWRMSRRFCQLYLLGQRRILQSSLGECRRLLQDLGAGT